MKNTLYHKLKWCMQCAFWLKYQHCIHCVHICNAKIFPFEVSAFHFIFQRHIKPGNKYIHICETHCFMLCLSFSPVDWSWNSYDVNDVLQIVLYSWVEIKLQKSCSSCLPYLPEITHFYPWKLKHFNKNSAKLCAVMSQNSLTRTKIDKIY